MKKTFLALVCLGVFAMTFAQKKTFQMELGVNYPIGLEKHGFKESHIGFFLNGKCSLFNSPLNANLKLSYDSYTIVDKEYGNSTSNGRTLYLMPSLNYSFPLSSKSAFYAGAGAGISANNINKGVFNDGTEYLFIAAPQIGLELFNHVNTGAQYNLAKESFSRLMVSVGYMF